MALTLFPGLRFSAVAWPAAPAPVRGTHCWRDPEPAGAGRARAGVGLGRGQRQGRPSSGADRQPGPPGPRGLMRAPPGDCAGAAPPTGASGSGRERGDCAGASGAVRARLFRWVTLRPCCPGAAMAVVRALVAPRLAAASTFAPLPGLRPLLPHKPAPSPRAALHGSAPRPGARVALVSARPRALGRGPPRSPPAGGPP